KLGPRRPERAPRRARARHRSSLRTSQRSVCVSARGGGRAEQPRRLELGFRPLGRRLGVGNDSGPDAQMRLTLCDRERSDGNVEVPRVALGVDPAHSTAVHTTRYWLEILDELHDARLGGSRHRRRWKRRTHERADAGTGTATPTYGADEMMEARVCLGGAQRGHDDRTGLAHTTEVVAREVDDHDVLGPILRARAQRPWIGARPLDRSGPAAGPPPRQEPLR